MTTRAETLEKIVGRRAVSCLGWALLLLILLLLLALLWPRLFPGAQHPGEGGEGLPRPPRELNSTEKRGAL